MNNPSILVTDNVHELLLNGLVQLGFTYTYLPKISLEDVYEQVDQFDGIVINSKIIMDKAMLDKGKRLKFIARLGSGLEIIDLNYAKKLGVAVLSAPDGNCDAVAEQAIGMLLSLANHSIRANAEVKKFIWERERNRGFELMGKTIGLIGFGHAGSAMAKRLSGFGMRILAFDKYKPKGYTNEYPEVEEVGMDAIFDEAEVVSFHLPLTEETIGLCDKAYLDRFQHSIRIVNTSRGAVIKTKDLITALESEKVLGICMDVFENEKPHTYSSEEQETYKKLFAFEQVVVSPHVAGWTVESKERLASILLEKIKRLNLLSA